MIVRNEVGYKMDIRCEGCGATPTPAQELCRFCGTKFDYSLLETAEEMVIETNDSEDSVEVELKVVGEEDLQVEEHTGERVADEADSKVISIRESAQFTNQPEPEKGVFKKLFRKKSV